MRHGLNGDLGFTVKDRKENIRRVGHLARLFYEHGNIVLCTFMSPFANDRAFAKSLIEHKHDFIEIHVTCNPKTAQQRDPKGLYAKAKLAGEITGLTGYDAKYEAPMNPQITINTDEVSVEEGRNTF